jgi:hypothetical protein
LSGSCERVGFGGAGMRAAGSRQAVAGVGGAAAAGHCLPRGHSKRARDTDSDEDNDDGSVASGDDEDGGDSEAARRVLKRMRAEGACGSSDPGEHSRDPARRLMVAAQKATVAHTMAMRMERKLGVAGGASSSSAPGAADGSRGLWGGGGSALPEGGGGGAAADDGTVAAALSCCVSLPLPLVE